MTSIASDHFAGLPICDVPTDDDWPTDPAGYAWRVSGLTDHAFDDERFIGSFVEALHRLAAQPWADQVKALVFGAWDSGYIEPPDWDALVEPLRAFTGLEHFFLGDIDQEEAEITWIRWGDPAPAFAVMPGLKTVELQGCAEECTISGLSLAELESLTVTGGGLLNSVLDGVLAADLPKLRELSLALGEEDYTEFTSADQLAPLLSGKVHTGVRRLGLRNCWIQDEVVEALVSSGRLATVDWLDLGGGTLTDRGARALIDGDLGAVKELVIVWHYMTEEVVAELRAAHPEVEMTIEEPEEPEDFGDGPEYFTEIGE